MGARPSTFRKGGGGFLNNVDGTIAGYRFTDEFNGEPFVPGKKDGKEKFHSLFMELSVRLDGADADITQNLFAGNADEYEISEDGLTLTATEDGAECSIGQNSPAGKFLGSLVEKGFPEAKLSDDPNSINVEPILGTRVRFAQETVMGKDGKPRKRVAKKGKFKGREFDDTTTVVAQVYDLPGKAGKAGKPAPGKAGKAAKDEDDEEDGDDQTVEALATETLIDIVTANKGKMAKEKLSMAILQKLMKHPQREPVRKLLKSDDFLETEDGWEYNAKKGVVTVAADEDED